MGLFDGLKMMGDIVKGSIATAKASGKMTELIERSRAEFMSLITPEQEQLYQEYIAMKQARHNEPDEEKRSDMQKKVEEAAGKYLSALAADERYPQLFRDEITSNYAELDKIDARIDELNKQVS